MNWVDLVVLAVLGLSGLIAFMRGFVREVLGIGSWAAALAAAWLAFPVVQPIAREKITDPNIADIAAAGGVFLITLIVMWMVAGALSGLVRDSILGGLDRTLGLVFGLVRGAVLVVVAYVLLGIAFQPEQWPPAVAEARSLPTVYRGAVWLAAQIPAAYRPVVAVPPAGRPTTSASLLQSSPTGRATGARPVRE